MPPEHGRRLAGMLPQGRLVEIADSYTLIPEDQPVELARAIRVFVHDTPRSRAPGAWKIRARRFAGARSMADDSAVEGRSA